MWYLYELRKRTLRQNSQSLLLDVELAEPEKLDLPQTFQLESSWSWLFDG
jgi:hypothetical protein